MKPKVLFGDDDESLRKLLKMYLQREGFDTDLVFTSKDLIEKAREAVTQNMKYNFIISDNDYKDGGVNGVEAVREIRKFDQETIIILQSGDIYNENDELAIRARESGASYSIPKMGFNGIKGILAKLK